MAKCNGALGPGSDHLSLHVRRDGEDRVGELSAHRANIFPPVDCQSLVVGPRSLPTKTLHVALVTSQVDVVAA